MVYGLALLDQSIRGLVISGFAYNDKATAQKPKNMLMIFGKYDEFRQRMTGTGDFEKEWMGTDRTRKVFPVDNPRLSTTYGDFKSGTARRVFMPKITHLHTSHSSAAVAEALQQTQAALADHTAMLLAFDNELRKKVSAGEIDPSIRELNQKLKQARAHMEAVRAATQEAWDKTQQESDVVFAELQKNATEISRRLKQDLGLVEN